MIVWENDEWYLAHKARWDALELAGWKFRKPTPLFNRVGLTMFREGDNLDSYTWYIAKDQTPEEIHRGMLERCEYHAANYAGVQIA